MRVGCRMCREGEREEGGRFQVIPSLRTHNPSLDGMAGLARANMTSPVVPLDIINPRGRLALHTLFYFPLLLVMACLGALAGLLILEDFLTSASSSLWMCARMLGIFCPRSLSSNAIRC